jgi:hypothetical protein
MTTNTDIQSSLGERFPILSRMRLNPDEWQALSRQGFVHSEQRGAKTVCRLRFRAQGRQRVRYVRRDDFASLEEELAELQKHVRARRHLNLLTPLARAALRASRAARAPILEASGHRFHGYTIRRRRTPLT